MRTLLTRYGSKINIVEHIILKNGWEYFVTDEQTEDNNVKFCLVMGYETELGCVYIPEITPYIVSKTNNLNDLLPAEGCKWVS